ncbi:hypothetical protein SHLI107390_03560 [Shewanella livingstonensis]
MVNLFACWAKKQQCEKKRCEDEIVLLEPISIENQIIKVVYK